MSHPTSTRDTYYQNLESYKYLKEWVALMKCGKITTAIKYWKTNRLDPNSYVQKATDNWVPVFYYSCLDPQRGSMVKYLLGRKNLDPTLSPDSDNYDYLPFVCASLFLKTLVSKIPLPYKRNVILDRSIQHRFNAGDATRLGHLITLGAIEEDTIKEIIAGTKDIIYDKLEVMIKYLTYCYNIKAQHNPDLNLTEETSKTIDKFRTTFTLMVNYGALRTQECIDYCIAHYLYELIPVLWTSNMTLSRPIYHTQMDRTHVAIMRPLLNDCRYEHICRVTGYMPDEDVYNYNIDN